MYIFCILREKYEKSTRYVRDMYERNKEIERSFGMIEDDPFGTSKMVINILVDIDLLSLDLHFLVKADTNHHELKRKIDLLHRKISKLCLYSDFISNACIKFESDKSIDNTTDTIIKYV